MSIVEQVQQRFNRARADRPPMPPRARTWHPLGMVPSFQQDPIGTMMSLASTHGDVVEFRMGPKVAYLIRRPEDVRRVLVDQTERRSARVARREDLPARLRQAFHHGPVQHLGKSGALAETGPAEGYAHETVAEHQEVVQTAFS